MNLKSWIGQMTNCIPHEMRDLWSKRELSFEATIDYDQWVFDFDKNPCFTYFAREMAILTDGTISVVSFFFENITWHNNMNIHSCKYCKRNLLSYYLMIIEYTEKKFYDSHTKYLARSKRMCFPGIIIIITMIMSGSLSLCAEIIQPNKPNGQYIDIIDIYVYV